MKDVTERGNESLGQLKEILRMSDGEGISKFADRELELVISVDELKELAGSHAYLSWNDMKAIVEKSVQSAIRSFRVPVLKNMPIKELLMKPKIVEEKNKDLDCGGRISIVERVRTENRWLDDFTFQMGSDDRFTFLTLTEIRIIASLRGLVTSVFKETRMMNFRFCNCDAKSVFVEKGFMAIRETSIIVKILQLEADAFVCHIKIKEQLVPLEFCLVWDKAFEPSQANVEFTFLVWNLEEKQVELTDSDGKQEVLLVLPDQPKVTAHFENSYAFLDSQNSVNIFNRKSLLKLRISNVQHGLSSVNNIKFTNPQT